MTVPARGRNRRYRTTDGSHGPAATLDLAALTPYLTDSGMVLAGPLTADLIPGGRSNLTFRVTDGSSVWILRRPPLGHVLATAHDMRREHVVLEALEPTPVPTPAPVLLCEDDTVIGAPFMMMELVPGIVVGDRASAQTLSPVAARSASEALVDVLAEIHRVPVEEVGLRDLGRPPGFLGRQVRRWRRQWAESTDRPSPRFEALARALERSLPAQSRATLVHGDYRLGNVILSPSDPARIAAVIDWEMATLGDPLADLGMLLAYWNAASTGVTAGGHAILANPGFLTAEQVVERYARHFEIDTGTLPFYEAFGLFKLAVIGQTIVARYCKGHAIGDGLPEVAGAVDTLLEEGHSVASRLPAGWRDA